MTVPKFENLIFPNREVLECKIINVSKRISKDAWHNVLPQENFGRGTEIFRKRVKIVNMYVYLNQTNPYNDS